MPRIARLLTLICLLTLGSTLAQPNLAGATALPSLSPALAPTPLSTLLAPDQLAPEQEPADQSGGSNDTRPGPIVQQAFGLLMDHFVTPPDADEVLNGGLNGAQDLLASKNLGNEIPGGRPSFTGERRKDLDLFFQVYARVAQKLGNKATHDQLDRAIVDGMAKSLHEQHTYYMSPDEFSRQQSDLQNRTKYAGVGIAMSQSLIITDVFEGSPAEAAGILPGDRLLAVNGEPIEGLSPTETSDKVRGEAGTPVTLKIQREGVPDPIEKTMTRATIAIQWLRAKILDDGIGYLQIRTFANPEGLPLFNQAIQKFLDANVKALVIDLRNNSGGAVATGQEIASRLIPDDRPLYRQVDRRRGERTVSTWGDYWNHDVPIAVLTNENSASMSEILASALQENGIGKVFGVKTAGAVAAGVPYPLVDGSGLLVTVQVITSGQGKVLNEVGLDPDEVIPLDTEQLRQGKDNQLDAALTYVREQASQRSPAHAGV